MEWAEQGQGGLPERLQAIAQNLDINPELTRRTALVGMGFAGLTALQGIGVALKWPRTENSQVSAHDLEDTCEQYGTACHLEAADIDVPSSMKGNVQATDGMTSTAVQQVAATTAPPTSITTIPVTATTAATNTAAILSAHGQPIAHARSEPACEFKVLSTLECVWPDQLPSNLPFQRMDTNDPAEIERINDLLEAITLSPERYMNFKIDTSHAEALGEIMTGKNTWPTISVNHWVGYEDDKMTDDIGEYIERMKQSGLSYHNLVMNNGTTHLLAPRLHNLIGHARYANWESAGTAANANSVYSLTPEMLEAMIYVELWSDKEYQRQMTRENSRSHAEVVRHDGHTKIDWPSQLQDGFYQLKLELNHLVYEQGKASHPSPFIA